MKDLLFLFVSQVLEAYANYTGVDRLQRVFRTKFRRFVMPGPSPPEGEPDPITNVWVSVKFASSSSMRP